MKLKYRQRNDSSGRYNHEGYEDLTAYLALEMTERERRIHRHRRRRAAKATHIRPFYEQLDLPEGERFLWEELGNAVVIQAAADWREAKAVLRRPVTCEEDLRKRKEAVEMIRETEEFFLSNWYCLFTAYDGLSLLYRLKKEEEKTYGV